jgi:hypothetical protein
MGARGRLFSPVPGCSGHAGPQKDRRIAVRSISAVLGELRLWASRPRVESDRLNPSPGDQPGAAGSDVATIDAGGVLSLVYDDGCESR